MFQIGQFFKSLKTRIQRYHSNPIHQEFIPSGCSLFGSSLFGKFTLREFTLRKFTLREFTLREVHPLGSSPFSQFTLWEVPPSGSSPFGKFTLRGVYSSEELFPTWVSCRLERCRPGPRGSRRRRRPSCPAASVCA